VIAILLFQKRFFNQTKKEISYPGVEKEAIVNDEIQVS
jgi:hypothetical protein